MPVPPRHIKCCHVQEVPFSSLVQSDLFNLRVDSGDIESLVTSILTQGLLEPIRVKETIYGEYMVVHGQRRYAALLQLDGAGYVPANIPVIVEPSTTSDTEALVAFVASNFCKNLLSIEESFALLQLREGGMRYDQIAKAVGKTLYEVLSVAALCDDSDELKKLLKENEAVTTTLDSHKRISKSLIPRRSIKKDPEKLPRIPKEQLQHLTLAFEEYKADKLDIEKRARLESMLQLLGRPFDDLDNLEISQL